MEPLIHAANVLLLLSFLVRDILWLRALNVLAGFAFIAYFAWAEPPMLAPVGWNLLFVSINVVQIGRLWLERRPVRFKADEQAMYRLAFRALSPREFQRLLAIARWTDADPGERVFEQGAAVDRVLVVHAGKLEVVCDGARVAELGPGRLVGEMGFITEQATSAAVVAAEPTRFLAFPAEPLRALFKRDPELRASMQTVIGADLVAKLRAA